MAQVNMYLDSQGWWPFQNHKKNAYYRLYSINRGGNPGELPLPLVGLHISPPPPVCLPTPWGLIRAPLCVFVCLLVTSVFLQIQNQGIFLYTIIPNFEQPHPDQMYVVVFFPFLKCFSVSLSSGVFWISWECVMQFFDVIYMNWNPKLFKYRFSLHS